MTGRDDEADHLTDGQLGVLSPDAWRDVARTAEERVADLLRRMTLAEKVGQLRSTWPGSGPDGTAPEASGGSGGALGVAPLQAEIGDPPADWPELIRDGLGQLTRPFGTRPVTAREGAEALARAQRQIVAAGRFGIPAIAHDECLAGFTAWTAAIFPIPLAWGASFDPPLVEQMAAQIGTSMRAVGVHQGLAPVLDVTVDPRWGRTEETIGEDPYLVATVGTAYVRGLESTGLICTLKHFAGYSASRGGRNLAPAAITSRQVADVLLPPFEMAIRLGGARSVMHAYTDIDGIPTAADPYLLSEVLREAWDFTGTVVADYFGISFLELLHGVASGPTHAAGLALAAGVDVELPAVRCFGPPLVDAVRRGEVDESLVDRAARRVLLQKCELGMLDPGWDADQAGGAEVDLAPPSARQIAGRLAEESVVLLANDGILPLPGGGRIAVVGPRADDPLAMLGCYSFPSHVGVRYPGLDLGVEIPTFLAALREELPGSQVTFLPGCGVDDPDQSGLAAAAALAAGSDVCIAVMGDRSGLFGRGTSGEGCDAADLNLPGVQGQLLQAVLATGTPVVIVLLAGRPYALGPFPASAVLQAFFLGQEGGPALARILSGTVNPSGRLPVSVPRHAGAQPATYIGPALAHRTTVSALDPGALYPFGHGLSYTTFQWEDIEGPASAQVPTDGTITVSLTVANTGERSGAEVVQIYLHDPVAQVTRPTVLLVGYARLELEPGERRRIEFAIHTDLVSFTGRSGQRIVEPGRIELRLGASSTDIAAVVPVELTGPERTLSGPRTMTARVTTETRAGLPRPVLLKNLSNSEGEVRMPSPVLTVRDGAIVDGSGHRVILRGYNIGGWMNIENFLTGYPGTESQHRRALRRVLGPELYDAFFDEFMTVFFGDADARYLASLGLNSVRIPFNYRHFEDDARPFELKDEGFALLDRAIAHCARHGLYAVLDFHALPGSQNQHWHSDNETHKAGFWVYRHFQDRVVHLWEALAARYRGNTTVAGYNIMNEPADPDGATVKPFYDRVVEAVRQVDRDHIIFLDGNRYSTDFSAFSGAPVYPNTVYTAHDYALPGFIHGGPYPGLTQGVYVDRAHVEETFLRRTEFMRRTGTPIWIGEFGPVFTGDPERDEQKYQLLADQLDIYRRHSAGWAIWAYKDVGGEGLVSAAPDSPWMRRIRDIMAKKARLGVDHWGSLDTEIRHIMTPIEETFSKEYRDFDPFPFGQQSWINTLVRNILLAEPMVDEFARCFADVTAAETARALAGSFRLGNCVIRERLADVLSAAARQPA